MKGFGERKGFCVIKGFGRKGFGGRVRFYLCEKCFLSEWFLRSVFRKRMFLIKKGFSMGQRVFDGREGILEEKGF
jgi:hypothetical protein